VSTSPTPAPLPPVDSLSGPALAEAVHVALHPEHQVTSSLGQLWYSVNGRDYFTVPDYPNDIAAAWQVVEWLHEEHHCVRIEANRHARIDLVSAWRMDTHPLGWWGNWRSGVPATEPHRIAEAICRVAVAALRAQNGGAL